MEDELNEVDLFEILADPTQERSSSTVHAQPVDSSDFSQVEQEDEEEEESEPYDAVSNATKLVNLINTGNIVALMPLAQMTLKKKRGGNKALDRMKIAYQKNMEGKKLTETEEKSLQQFELYKADLALLNGEIPFSKAQHDALMKCAVPYCEATKMKINDSFAFWGVLAGFETGKIIKILSA